MGHAAGRSGSKHSFLKYSTDVIITNTNRTTHINATTTSSTLGRGDAIVECDAGHDRPHVEIAIGDVFSFIFWKLSVGSPCFGGELL